MPQRHASRLPNRALLVTAIVVSLGIVMSEVPAGHTRNALLSLNWFVWLLFVVTYPMAVLSSGFVTGTQPTSISHRASAPARFWTGFVATTAFWVAVFAAISVYSVMAWYHGA